MNINPLFIEDLKRRNLVKDIMPGTEDQLLKEMTSGYIGFDPTSDSLHVGSLLPITLLMRLQRAGHKPIAVIGGATGMIGDPSGKSQERNLLDVETLNRNCEGLKSQLSKFLDFESQSENTAELLNNYDWMKNWSFLDFIRDVGKNVNVSYMMSKDSVKSRMETGLSFTEFTYQLLQGYDFQWLNSNKNVKLQMGGADQWGNITTGSEMIRKTNGNETFAFTCPLVTKNDGSKFGKSESGNVWLDRNKTSPYKFYQFWVNQSDEDAIKMMYTFSFRSVDEIDEMVEAHQANPHLRIIQNKLADELTILVHSQDDLDTIKKASRVLFSNNVSDLKGLSKEQFVEIMDGVPQVNVNTPLENTDLVSFLVDNKIFESKGEVRRLIKNNGLSVNKVKVKEGLVLNPSDLLNDQFLLVQKGKAGYTLVTFFDGE